MQGQSQNLEWKDKKCRRGVLHIAHAEPAAGHLGKINMLIRASTV